MIKLFKKLHLKLSEELVVRSGASALSTTLYAIEILCTVIGSISTIAVFVISGLRFKEV